MKIAIGITTFNRSKWLDEVIDNINKYTENEYRLVIACDSEESANYCKKKEYNYIGGDRLGIAKNKNRCIKYFENYDYDYMFLFDDDTYPIKKGYDNWWINGMKAFGVHALVFSPGKQYGEPMNKFKHGDYILQNFKLDGGCFLTFSKKAINTIGGFHPKFNIYGFEHSELNNRCYRAGLIPMERMSLANCDEWMEGKDMLNVLGKLNDDDRLFDQREKEEKIDRAINQNLYKDEIEENNKVFLATINKSNIYQEIND